MKRTSDAVPLIAIFLVLLACIRFEYRGEFGEVIVPGLFGGLVVLGIVGIVLLFRIFNTVQDACIARGILGSRIHCKYDILIPVAIVAVAVKGRWYSERIEDMQGEAAFNWELAWSDSVLDVPFIAAIVGIVLLLRILYLLRAITSG